MRSDHEASLLDAIAKQNVLLMAINSKRPDFAFLHSRDVLLQQAHCWLNLARIRRMVLSRTCLSHGPEPTALNVDSIVECLSHAREIYFSTENSTTKSFVHGQILVLVEEAQLSALLAESSEALRTFDEALQLCFATGDHATASHVTSKMQALRLDLDMWARLDQLATDPQENASERDIFKKCFLNVRGHNGTLDTDQLAALARELGAQTPLSTDEVDEVWKQICAHTPFVDKTEKIVSFEALWRWWMAEEMYEYRNQCRRNRV